MKTDEENIAAIQQHVREYQEREAMSTADVEKTANRQQENLFFDAVTILASITKKETAHGAEYHNDVDAQNWALREPYELAYDYVNRVMKDDHEPVTLAWLGSIGRSATNPRNFKIRIGYQWLTVSATATRGDFRTLVRILEGDKK